MSVPGGNLLKKAQRLIRPESVEYYVATGRTNNAIGNDVTAFAAPITAKGNVQPVPRGAYQYNGLDFQKSYVNFYASLDMVDIQRDVSTDEFVYDGKRYQVMSCTDWHGQDGWKAGMAVEIGSA